jgi:hypothetical protein
LLTAAEPPCELIGPSSPLAAAPLTSLAVLAAVTTRTKLFLLISAGELSLAGDATPPAVLSKLAFVALTAIFGVSMLFGFAETPTRLCPGVLANGSEDVSCPRETERGVEGEDAFGRREWSLGGAEEGVSWPVRMSVARLDRGAIVGLAKDGTTWRVGED